VRGGKEYRVAYLFKGERGGEIILYIKLLENMVLKIFLLKYWKNVKKKN
jgi:hypothetical protein